MKERDEDRDGGNGQINIGLDYGEDNMRNINHDGQTDINEKPIMKMKIRRCVVIL